MQSAPLAGADPASGSDAAAAAESDEIDGSEEEGAAPMDDGVLAALIHELELDQGGPEPEEEDSQNEEDDKLAAVQDCLIAGELQHLHINRAVKEEFISKLSSSASPNPVELLADMAYTNSASSSSNQPRIQLASSQQEPCQAPSNAEAEQAYFSKLIQKEEAARQAQRLRHAKQVAFIWARAVVAGSKALLWVKNRQAAPARVEKDISLVRFTDWQSDAASYTQLVCWDDVQESIGSLAAKALWYMGGYVV